MKVLQIIYLTYMFISFYFIFLFLMLYLKNRKTLFDSPEPQKNYSVSFIIPAYNEGETIRETIEHIFDLDYKNIKEVIVVNDGSTDNTREVIEELKRKYKNLILINNEKNLGNAGLSKNVGFPYATGDLVAVTDADSYPAKDSLRKMVGFFNDEKVGAVTCPVLVRNPNTFLGGLQEIEYRVIAFTRKLLGFVDSIYVTPGPLAVYRKKALDEVGSFDGGNLTEDIEIAWRLLNKKWKIKMPLFTKVTTTAPTKFKEWYKQRIRWGVGGIQCIAKYKKQFLKKGILGLFVIPFFLLQFFLGLLGLSVFFYLVIKNIVFNSILFSYSISSNVPLVSFGNFFFVPSFINCLGFILFVFGTIFSITILTIMKKNILKKQNIFNILFYSVFYLTIYPFIALHSIYKYFKRDCAWR